jgi:hypothetical protein
MQVVGQMLDVLDNLCITYGTLSAFCVGQGLFWVVVGSKQFETVVKDKVEIARLFLDNSSNKTLKLSFCKKLNSMVTSEDAERVKSMKEENVQMMKDRFWPFFAITFSVFFFTLIIVILKYINQINRLFAAGYTNDSVEMTKLKAKRKGFFIGLFLVLFSFSTEIFIFKYIIQPYIVIGDIEIINGLIG